MWQANGRLLISNQHNDINTTLSHIGERSGVGFVSLTESTRLFASDMGANDRGVVIFIFLLGGKERLIACT